MEREGIATTVVRQQASVVIVSPEAGIGALPACGDTLDAHALATVSRLASLILPAADPQNGGNAGVAAFVDRLLSEWYAAEDRDRFVDDLAALDARCRAAHGAPFLTCGEEAQRAVLTAWDTEVTRLRADAATRGEAQRHLFARLKTLTLIGYFTSEEAQQREPRACDGTYDGHAPYGGEP